MKRKRQGFTLIEVLMVIAIIGILVGLLIPAVNIARTAIKKSALAMEVVTLSNAIEQYREKYGDYPPDGSNSAVFARHCRKVFPQIAASELADVYFAVSCNQQPLPWPSGTDPRVMDPTEALVFFLGGFSDDPVHPFTGTGGPIQVTARDSAGNATEAQYNVDRNSPLYEFKESQLTLEVVGALTLSSDEALYGLAASGPDAIPAYHPAGLLAPYVYFDARTYSFGSYVNHFSPGATSPVSGYARPYKSETVNTSVSYSAGTADQFYRYMNEKTFQLVSAGLDDDYGGLDPLAAPTQFFVYPTGKIIDISIAPTGPQPGAEGYVATTSEPSKQLDNATNFSEGVLENSLP